MGSIRNFLSWRELNRFQRWFIVGTVAILAMTLVVSLGVAGTVFYGALTSGKLMSNFFLFGYAVGSSLASALTAVLFSGLIIFLIVKIGGTDQPLLLLRFFVLSFLIIPELGWLSCLLVSLYQIFFSWDYLKGYVEVVGILSGLTLPVGLLFGFFVWGITMIVAENRAGSESSPEPS